jgi:hypothetical protein
MQNFFSAKYSGISVQVNATKEAIPGEDITIIVWINCTADNVKINHLNVSIYGFRNGVDKTLLDTIVLWENTSLVYHEIYQRNQIVHVPDDVWDAMYVDMQLEYSIMGSLEGDTPSFSVTVVKNTLLEQLKEQLESVNEALQNMTSTFQQLNETYWRLHQNYTNLEKNYTSLNGSLIELDTTRRVVAIFIVTTVFFVATTFYLILRKPKSYY